MPEADETIAPYVLASFASIPDDELELAEVTLRSMALTMCNHSLLEGMKAGNWFWGSAWASGLVLGLVGGLIVINGTIPWSVSGVAAGLLVAGAICLAGGQWHRRRAIQFLVEGRKVDDRREHLRAELRRRGLLDE